MSPKKATKKESAYTIISKKTETEYGDVTVPKQDYITGEHFWLVDFDFFDVLHVFDRSSSQVVMAVISTVHPKDNILHVSCQKLSEKAGCGIKTVEKALALMEENDIIVSLQKPTPQRNGKWMLNPYLLVKKSALEQQILEAVYDQHKGKEVSQYCVVNKETGETFPLPRWVTPETIGAKKGDNFLKVYNSFFTAFPGMTQAKLDVFSSIIKNKSWVNNDVHFSAQDLAELSGASESTVHRTLKELREHNIISAALGVSYFAVNPDLIVQGRENKRHAINYDIKKAEQRKKERAERRKAQKKQKEEAQAADTAQTRFPVPPIPLCLRQKLEQSELPAKTAISAVVEQTEPLKYPVPEYHAPAPVENSSPNQSVSSQDATQQPHNSPVQAVPKNWVGNFPVPGLPYYQKQETVEIKNEVEYPDEYINEYKDVDWDQKLKEDEELYGPVSDDDLPF